MMSLRRSLVKVRKARCITCVLVSGVMVILVSNVVNYVTRRSVTSKTGPKWREVGSLFPHLSAQGLPQLEDIPYILNNGGRSPPWVQRETRDATKGSKERIHVKLPLKIRGPMPWKDHIKGTCEENGVAWNRENFKPEMLKHIVVDDVHKILFCPIPKVACTTWGRVMLALTGHIKMEDTFRLPGGHIHDRWKLLNYLSNYSREEVLNRLDNYYKFIVVRNPYERILSAYRNKFETQSKLNGFHFVYGKPIVRKYRTSIPWRNIPIKSRYIPKFTEYVEYLSDANRGIRMNNHWEKFYILCQPCIVQYDFVGNMETMEDDAKIILKAIGVSNKLSVPSRQKMGYRHKKTKDVVSKYFQNVSRSTIDDLFKEYRLDFEIFNMTSPEEYTISKVDKP